MASTKGKSRSTLGFHYENMFNHALFRGDDDEDDDGDDDDDDNGNDEDGPKKSPMRTATTPTRLRMRRRARRTKRRTPHAHETHPHRSRRRWYAVGVILKRRELVTGVGKEREEKGDMWEVRLLWAGQ